VRFLIVLMLLATCAQAVPVDPVAEDGIAAWSGKAVLCTSGEVYYFNDGPMIWEQPFDGGLNVPVPVEQIIDWSYTNFVSETGEHWCWAGDAYGWRLIPPPPCAELIPNRSQSMGGVKSIFR